MKMKLFYLIGIAFISIATADIVPESATSALNQFAFKFLGDVHKLLPNGTNVVISPLTIWTALSIVNEGARGNTAVEIERTLGIPSDDKGKEAFRKLHQDIAQNLVHKEDGVNMELLNAMFTKLDAKLKTEFKKLAEKIYNVQVESLNFTDVKGATQYINQKLSNATHGRVPEVVDEDSVRNAEMFLTSALFFKGIWDKQFAESDTRNSSFYNEIGKVIATVPMMHNSGNFPFARVLDDRATAVELPYKGDRMSMIVMLPARRVSLQEMLKVQTQTPLHVTLGILKRARETFQDSTVTLALPKFKLSSNLLLNDILRIMGIRDAFGLEANLKGIADGQLYVSSITHKAEIEVDEEGTVGSAVTVVEIMDRVQAPFFNANKPFAFFVVDKVTHTTVLMGIVNNPK